MERFGVDTRRIVGLTTLCITKNGGAAQHASPSSNFVRCVPGESGSCLTEQLESHLSYWNGDVHGCDFAFDSVGVIVLQTMNRLEEEAELVIEKGHPEQSMLALLKVLDLLIDEFPKCVAVHFRKRKYLAIREKYLVWLDSCAKVPENHTDEFEANAKALFESLNLKLKVDAANE